MTVFAKLLWVTGLMSAAIFAYLAWLSSAHLTYSDMLKPFDARLTGLSAVEGRAYLQTLTLQAREVYLGPFRIWDTIFPALLTLTMIGLILRQTNRLPRWGQGLLLVPPLAYLAADYTENAWVAELLRAKQVILIPDEMILRVSLCTQSKWALLAVALGLCIWAMLQERPQKTP